MDNNRVVGIVITGDAKGLQQTLDAAGKQVGDFGKKVETFEQAWAQGHSRMQAMNSTTALSAKQLQFAMNGLPAQITDIVTSLQAGQRPLTVLLQQGGQLKDMFGGFVPMFRALGGYLVGLISPFSLVAAGVGLLGAAYYMGSKEQDAYNKALVTTGNAAGATRSDLQAYAQQISQTIGTQHAAAEAIAQMAASGEVGRENLQAFTTVAMQMDKYLGQPVEKTVAAFTELGKAPTEASAKLNSQLHYLTGSIYEQIKALEDRGQKEAAAELAQKTYADAMAGRTEQMKAQLGLLESAWMKLGGAAKGAWDWMLGVGREKTLDDKIAELQRALAGGPGVVRLDSGVRGKYQGELDLLIAQRDEQVGIASLEAQRAKQAEATVRLAAKEDEFLSSRQKMERELAALRNDAKTANWDDKRLSTAEANIRRKYRDNDAIALQKAQLERAIDVIRKSAEEEVDIEQGKQKRLDAARSLGLVSDADYFAQKRATLEAENRIKAQAVADEIALLSKQKFAKPEDAEANQRRINDLRATERKLQRETLLEGDLLTSKMTEAENKRLLAVMSVNQELESRIAQKRRAQDRAFAEIGMSNLERERSAGLGEISDHFAAKLEQLNDARARLEKTGAFNADERAQYAAKLAALKEALANETAQYEQDFSRRTAMQQDWFAGANQALKNYAENSRNIFSQMGQLFTQTADDFTNRFTKAFMGGKFGAQDFFRTITEGLVKIKVQQNITGPLTGALASASGSNFMSGLFGGLKGLFSANGNAFTGSGVVQAFANGGLPGLGQFANSIVTKPTMFGFASGVGLMGEKPGSPGEAILPLTRLSGNDLGVKAMVGGSTNVYVNVTNTVSNDVQATVTQRQGPNGTAIDVQISKIETSLAGRVAAGKGALSGVLSSQFGLNRGAGAV